MQFDRVAKDGETKEPVDVSTVELRLPSGGVDYGSLCDGTVQVRPPRVKEVEFLADMNPENYDEMLTRMIRSLVVSPVALDPRAMTIGDRQHLHVWTRAQIDPIYRFEAGCPNPKCGHVNEKFELKIESIPIKSVPDKYATNMKLTLPRSKSVVAVHLETARDRATCESMQDKGFAEWGARRALVITSVDGRQMSAEEKCEWFRGLGAGDDSFMTEYLKWQVHGPDFANCPFKCGKCGEEGVISMPFRLEFFMPTVQSANTFEQAIRGGDDVEDGGVPGDGGDSGDGVREVRVG